MKNLILKPKSLAGIFKKCFLSDKMKVSQEGAVLLIAILVLGIMLFLAGYFISFGLTGAEMSLSHTVATQTYYLTEAGVGEAIFKLKNDPVWKAAFETQPTVDDPSCSSWSIAPYTRDPALFTGGSYIITVTNLGCAQAEIESLATLQFSSRATARRVVRIKVFKAIGNPISEFNVFLGGPSENLDIRGTNPFNVYGGSLFSNKVIRLKDNSVVNVDHKALAGQNITVDPGCQLNATSCADNVCDPGCDASTDCPPPTVTMPPIDFNSGEPDSYVYQAENDDCSSIRGDGKTNCLFTPDEIEKAMWAHYPNFSLPYNVVVYVTGDFNLRAGQNLTVNGVLLADRDMNLGKDICWTRSEPPYLRCGSSRLTVIRPGVPEDNFPAGILAKRKFNTGIWLGIFDKALDVHGLIYSGAEMDFSSIAASIEVNGALAANKISFSSLWSGVDIYLDSDVIVDTFKDPQYSPVITIDHWEEEY